MNKEKPIQYLTGVGPKMAEKLKRLGIENIRDLIFYYPRTYNDYTHPQKIGRFSIGDEVIIEAEIAQVRQSRTKRKWMSIIEALLIDSDGNQIKAVWFNQSFLINVLRVGEKFLFAGKVGWDFKNKNKILSVTNIEKEPVILAVYPETEGLTSKYLRKLLLVSKKDIENIDDYLPEKIIKANKLISLSSALIKIHFPKTLQDMEKAKKRLAFDELLFFSLRMLLAKQELQNNNAVALKFDKDIMQKFVASLSFKLTNAQRKTAWEIIGDLQKKAPMNRLLEGDVGSGKTVVAVMAVLLTAKNKMQSVWLAPTEILANQHFQNVSKLLKPFNIKIGLLTGANKKADLEKDDLIIGTHALIQENVKVPRLALVVVDEQHRFGVKQRAHLRHGSGGTAISDKRYAISDIVPHFLSMTATPIPRTLALAFYGDLSISVLDEMPKGRQDIKTKIVAPKDRKLAYDFIKAQIKQGRQVFVICPLIEEGRTEGQLFDIDRKSVKKEYEKLSKEIFPEFSVGLMHGKLKSKEKEEVMEKFKNRKIDILVSTAVVEVGIDIPNATVMMVEGAENFGLAQLHQFRGRVGRGEHLSYCFLLTESWSEKTKERLNAMTTCNSGFELAGIDLKLRGPGELSGLRQSGLPDLKMASFTDTILMEEVKVVAEKIIASGIEKYPALKEKLDEFESEKHLE